MEGASGWFFFSPSRHSAVYFNGARLRAFIKRSIKMIEENKQIARQVYEECWNKAKLELVPGLYAKDCQLRDPVFPALAPGAESMKRHIQMCRTAFPDLKFTVNDMIAENDEVVVHWTAQGTQQDNFLGLSPTHRKATVGGTSIFRIKNGKIAEQWSDWNLLTLLGQLGIATTPKLQVTAV
jgi:steroid delta-isomerase-like uncharacterized protein